MGLDERNGHTESLDEVKQDISEIRGALHQSLWHLTSAVHRMADKFEILIEKKFVPLEVVVLLFLLAMGANIGAKVLDGFISRMLGMP